MQTASRATIKGILSAGVLAILIAATACSATTSSQTATTSRESPQATAALPAAASVYRPLTTRSGSTDERNPPTTISVQFTYEDTIEEMLATSNVAVIGTVVALSEKTDEGGALLMNYFEFEVTEWLVAPDSLADTGTAFVSVPDPSRGFDVAGSLNIGDVVMLMGEHIRQEGTPVPLPAGGLIAPSAEGTGIFDIDTDSNTATARSQLMLSATVADRVRIEPEITESGEELPLPNRPPLTVSLDQIRDLVPR